MAKKSFNITDIEKQLERPEETFISNIPKEEPQQAEQQALSIPLGYRLAKETKSKKTQVAFQPSLFNAVKEEADKQGESFNEMLHILLREALANRK